MNPVGWMTLARYVLSLLPDDLAAWFRSQNTAENREKMKPLLSRARRIVREVRTRQISQPVLTDLIAVTGMIIVVWFGALILQIWMLYQ